jgi:hypothetical protein
VDSSGNIFIADTGNGVIREVSASTGIITTVAGIPLSLYVGTGDGACLGGDRRFMFQIHSIRLSIPSL